MPFTIREEKLYPHGKEAVFQAALGAVAGLEGKVLKQDAEAGQFEAQFNKRILGKTLGDRTHLNFDLTGEKGGQSTVTIEAYPLDALGRKLMFGARKGVTRTVLDWFYAHLEHRLG